jgi:hypothetical protein
VLPTKRAANAGDVAAEYTEAERQNSRREVRDRTVFADALSVTGAIPMSAKRRRTRKGLTREESLVRADEMARLREDEKLTLKAIGERYGVTRQFVHQVLKARANRLRVAGESPRRGYVGGGSGRCLDNTEL